MITKTFTPKNKTNDPYFQFEIAFDGDIKKNYSCVVIGANYPCPKFIGFTTRLSNGINQNYMILEFAARCSNTTMTIGFLTEAEQVEEKKREYFTWISKYFTVFDFIFRLFKLKTLKSITKSLLIGIGALVLASTILTTIDYTYEEIYGKSILESDIVQWISEFTIIGISRKAKENGPEMIEDMREFIKDTAEDAKEKMADALEDAKEKAEDIKEDMSDKIDDLKE